MANVHPGELTKAAQRTRHVRQWRWQQRQNSLQNPPSILCSAIGLVCCCSVALATTQGRREGRKGAATRPVANQLLHDAVIVCMLFATG